MRRPVIAGNWKMNKTIGEALELANGIRREVYEIETVEIVLCPPYTALTEVAEAIASSNIKLGAQDLFWEDSGAYTGEISAEMLKDVGCEYVIIGHSERRQYFHETNESVNKKVKQALKVGLIPIMAVGENLKEREAGKTFDVVKDHIEGGLRDISSDQMQKIIIAYEPVWAIGTGKTATSGQAEEAQAFIRKLLTKRYSKDTADLVRIQYGGSVRPDNIKELMAQEDVDGALVGGASLAVDSFVGIVRGAV